MQISNGLAIGIIGAVAGLFMQGPVRAETPAEPDLAHQIFESMTHLPGNQPDHRLVHAKGIVCQGTFEPTKEAADLSTAPHFKATTAAVPVTVRFSDGSSDPTIPDNAPNAGPRGMAIRFTLASGEELDIVAMSHHGFAVATPAEFLALQQSVVATDPSKPHPWPVEAFLGTHPATLKFVMDNRELPESFATESFFANDAMIFVNKAGAKQPGRFQLIPVAGTHHLSEAQAKEKTPEYLMDDLKKRLAAEPIQFRVRVQLPNDGDVTKDPSIVWPDDRKTIELGMITIKAIAPDNAAADKATAFDPANLPDGIELSDDPFPALRSKVYALSVKRRRHTGG